jgi:hypothetical protein
LRSGGGAKLSI